MEEIIEPVTPEPIDGVFIVDKATGLRLDIQRPPEQGDWVEVVSNNGAKVARSQYHVPVVPSQPVLISITTIVGAEIVNTGNTFATCYELTPITISGTVAVPDRVFSLPLRRDDGRLFLFPVSVVAGAFSAVIDFPTSGQFMYSDIEANIDLPPGTFTIDTIRFDVWRKVVVI